MNGWMGKLLRINLTNHTSSIESSEKYLNYIGGKGIANRIMYEEVPAGTAPEAPENKVVFAVGPNTGASAPSSGRTTVSTLSCFTKFNAIVEGHVGGDTGVQMKACGYDALIVEGASDTPVYVYINDDKVEFRDASHLWGKKTGETCKMIAQETDQRANVITIGPAGENLVNLSCLITSVSHCCGGGIGKIFGCKKLKALAFNGTKGVQIAEPKKVQEINKYVMNDIIGAYQMVVPTTPQSWNEYEAAFSRWNGRPGLTWGAAEGGPVDMGEAAPGQPTRVGLRINRAVVDLGAAAEKYVVKSVGCATCPLRCYSLIKVPHMKETWGVEGVHSNTCAANYGCMLCNLVSNVQDVKEPGDGSVMAKLYCLILIDELGLWDNYSELAATLMYFMANDNKLMKQILTQDEYNAIDWSKRVNGDITFVKDIIECVINPKHSLYNLGKGAYYVDQKYHDILGDEYLNSAAVGLWGPLGGKRHHGNDANAQVGLLTNILYNRDGMNHSVLDLSMNGLPYAIQKSIAEPIWGEGCLDQTNSYTPMNEAKARFAKFAVMRQVLCDSFTLCNWVYPMISSPRRERNYKGDLSIELQYMNAVTGVNWTQEEMDHHVERTIQLHRAMTVLAAGTTDMRNEHDAVADYIFDSDPDIAPFTPGTTKMEREDWQKALTMFYEQFGWDSVTGAPTRATLEKFELKDVADELETRGLLP